MEGINRLYRSRFEGHHNQRDQIWKILCASFFQAFVEEGDTVLDIGAGYCEFINNIKCAKKYAVDLNEDTPTFANPDVCVFTCPSTDLSSLADLTVDVVFMSNFLEHLVSKIDVLKTLREIHRVLKTRGKVMILSPNIKYASKGYWDFFDHHIPLSDRSLSEALQMVGFRVEKILPKFLPFTTKSNIPKYPFLVKIYLRFSFVWQIMGRQMFIIGRKNG